jgi:hypothetical protein
MDFLRGMESTSKRKSGSAVTTWQPSLNLPDLSNNAVETPLTAVLFRQVLRRIQPGILEPASMPLFFALLDGTPSLIMRFARNPRPFGSVTAAHEWSCARIHVAQGGYGYENL